MMHVQAYLACHTQHGLQQEAIFANTWAVHNVNCVSPAYDKLS